MFKLITPKTDNQLNKYYHFRWQMLRAPWQQAEGSEKDELEQQACHRMIVVPDSSEVVAVGRVHFVDQDTAQIRYMAVSEAVQKQGLGRSIINALEQEATERGCQLIQLNARADAVQFYQALGYNIIQKTHMLYGEIQHYLMTKQLNNVAASIDDSVAELQDTWHATIPLSKAMNIKACYFDQQKFITSCDSLFNKNLHNTMFAGSIYTLATLTGWGWMYLQLKQAKIEGDIVLAHADIKYLKPIAGQGYASVEQSQVQGDLSPMTNGRHGKMTIQVNVLCGDQICAIFNGQFVAKTKR